MDDTTSAVTARKTWRTMEPLHGMVYFVPEAAEEYAALGVTGRDGYFASRAAPMGPVTSEVVVATFFNFNPALVRQSIPAAWAHAAPEALLDARLGAVDRAYRRLLGDDVLGSEEMVRASQLARHLAEATGASLDGRVLAASHAALPWPTAPHLVLWHAQSVLREYRGDAHVSLLVAHGLSGIDALVTHAADGAVPGPVLQSTRGWSDASWRESVVSMAERGWLVDGDAPAFTEWGAAQRRAIETGTDELSAAPYADLGDERCEELRRLTRPWSKVLVEEIARRSTFAG